MERQILLDRTPRPSTSARAERSGRVQFNERLSGKVVIVAAGAAGIGAATATRLASEGARVVIGDINGDGAEATAARLRDAGHDARAAGFDASDETSVHALIATAVDRHGRLDGVHFNAADLSDAVFGRDTDVVSVPLEVWDRTIDVGLTGCLRVFRAAIPELVHSGGGALVATSSNSSVSGDVQKVSYGVMKAGINALVRHTARRWGKDGVRANAVAPALTLTETVLAETREGWKQQVVDAMALPRLGEPEDIAAAVAFLLSDDASWVTGQTYHVNGGIVVT
jgi:NAD(P)-dependent dehydrogenase (short-subunit alcohol dehydrogenase family)